jgi:serine/threonine-protein kinase
LDGDTFFHQLRLSGLLASQTVDAVAARFSPSISSSTIARALVEEGLLTRFQAKQLRARKSHLLRLGPYRILEKIGQGGTGPVFKAVHQAMERVVAIKVVYARLLADPLTVDLFKREVRAASQLHHPGLVTAYDAGVAKGRHYLAMEYFDGQSLQAWVHSNGPLPIPFACELMRQAAEALQYAHEKGMVHRDIKPANLLIARSADPKNADHSETASAPDAVGRSTPLLKIIDFGLARLHQAGKVRMEHTIQVDPGAVWGTIDYISPEQAENIHAVDIRSDLYSLGCAFYYGLTGRVPFPGNAAVEKLLKHLLYDAPPANSIRPDIPAPVADILARLMAKERWRRYQTPAELARELTTLAPVLSRDQSSRSVCPDAEGPRSGSVVPQSTLDAVRAEPQVPPLPPGETSLPEDWARWTAMVRALMGGRAKRRRINPRSFQALHMRLVESCEAQAKLAEGPRRDFYERLAELVKPWVRPGALLEADKEIRCSLYMLCQEAGQELDQFATTLPANGSGPTALASIRALLRGLRGGVD